MPRLRTEPEAKFNTRVREVLVECFGQTDLEMLVSDYFPPGDDKLAWLVNDKQGFKAVVFKLIEKVEASGDMLTLLTAAAKMNKRPELVALRDEYLATSGGDGSDPDAIQEAVTRFNERFRKCDQQVKTLRDNKTLHDVLHQLKEQMPELERLLAGAAAPGYAPDNDAELFSDDLKKWAQMADACVPPRPAIDSRRKWVDLFARAIDLVVARLNRKPPAAEQEWSVEWLVKLDRTVEWLDQLPADQQPDLNERLLDTAELLDVVALCEPLDRLRTVLPADRAGELMDRFVTFRGDCGRMKRLTEQHRLCQLTDTALREADDQPAPTAVGLSQWADVVNWLKQIDPALLTDKSLATRAVEAAGKYAVAQEDATKLFAALRQRFDRLFLAVDTGLLTTTDRVVESARLLDALLPRFLG